jgi:RNA polymerase sigma-70 factor (sigma-E family)
MDRYEGFREFVLARRSALSRTAYLLTGDHAVAEDLLQASLVRTAEHWHRIAGGDPEAYLRRVMVNERTSRWRGRRYAVEIPTSTESLATLATSAGPGRSSDADTADAVVRRSTLVAALAQLPPRQRAVIVLRFFDDLSEAQTADVLGCAIGTVKSQTHLALARLRALAPTLLSDQEVST